MQELVLRMMDSIALWWQSAAQAFVDSIALFLPPLFGPKSPETWLPDRGLGVQTSDPLYTSYFSLSPVSPIQHLASLFNVAVVALVILKVTTEALRLYMARDAGESIISPTVFVRRVAITVMFALTCGWMVDTLGSTTSGTVTVVRTALYRLFQQGADPQSLIGTAHTKAQLKALDQEVPLTYPDVRTWIRDMGCWLLLPNNQPGGLLRMDAARRPVDGVPCMGAVAGSKEVTLHWLAPDAWRTNGGADKLEVYGDQRVYWLYRSTAETQTPGHGAERVTTVSSLTSFTDKNLTNGTPYYYWVGTWCWLCEQLGLPGEVVTGPLMVQVDGNLLVDSRTPTGRVFMNVLLAVSLATGVIVMVLQTAFRSIELIFAKMVGPLMALSAMNSDEPFSQGPLSLWLREVGVLVLSQIMQVIILCTLVSTISTVPPLRPALGTVVQPLATSPRFSDIVLALVLIAIGTQGPRILRHLAWSGDGGKASGLGSQFVSRVANKLPW